MSEESTPPTEPAPAAAPAAAAPVAKEGGASAKPERKERKPREPDVPVEELFDLSKPIPRVDRPDKAEHEKALDEISKEVDSIKEERQKIQTKIDETMTGGKGSEIGKQREAAQKLRSKKGALIEEKKKIRAQLDIIRSQGDKLAKDRKDARSNIRFNSVADIDKEIAKLQKRQETTSMSLSDEKKLIKEMDGLKASKSSVAELKLKETGLEDIKEKRKIISNQIGAKDKEIDAVQKDIDVVQAKIKEMSDKETDKRDTIKDLFTKRDDFRKSMNDLLKKKDGLRAEFREKNNAWYNYQRAARVQKQMAYEEEKKKRDEEKAAWIKLKAEEEAKKIPYEEEQALCDYLANYLTRTYLTDAEEAKKKAQEEFLAKKEADTIAVKEDPFASFKPMTKKLDEEYFGKGKGKKKRDRGAKKKEKAVAGPFTLNVDSFEQFGLLSLDPPTSLEQVPKTVEDLKAKKIWYSEQPRGSVPTATDIRKSNEKAAAKLRQKNDSAAVTTTKKDGKFALSNDDFAPLGAGTASSSINASWGQKAPEEAAAEEAAEAPADDAEIEA